jgi:DNA repair protein RecO (recombination protein O)
MPRITDDAVVLRRWEFSETSQTVLLLARTHGLVRGLAKGALRPNGNFGGGFEPMTMGNVGFVTKDGRDLATMTEWRVEEVWWPLRQMLKGIQHATWGIDMVGRMLAEHDPHPEVYDALVTFLTELAQGPRHDAAMVRFQWALLSATGHRPVVDRDVRTGQELPSDATMLHFSVIDGGMSATAGPGDLRVRPDTAKALQAIAAGAGPQTLDADAQHRCARLLAACARGLIGDQTPALDWLYPDLPR